MFWFFLIWSLQMHHHIDNQHHQFCKSRDTCLWHNNPYDWINESNTDRTHGKRDARSLLSSWNFFKELQILFAKTPLYNYSCLTFDRACIACMRHPIDKRHRLAIYWLLLIMTTRLTHTVAHSTKPSFRPKTNNQPLKKFLSPGLSWAKVVKNWTSF